MTELRPLYVSVDDYYGPDELGLPYRDIVGEGYVTGLGVTQRAAGANLSVDVAAGACWVQGDTDASGQPTYRCRNDATVNLTITPDASNPRNVIIVAEVLDDDFDSGSQFIWRLRAVHGTPAGSPADPATPTSAIRLARVNVTAADADITDAQIDDLRAPANFGGGGITLWSRGLSLASASTLAVTHPYHKVTGTTNVTGITAMSNGFVVTLEFASALRVVDGSNLKLAGDFHAQAEATLTLVCDGTNWFEVSRTPAHSQVLDRTTAAASFSNTVAEQTLYSVSIPGGAIGIARDVVMRGRGDYLNNDGVSVANIRFKAELDGVEVLDSGAPIPAVLAASSLRYGWEMEIRVAALGAVDSQWVTLTGRAASNLATTSDGGPFTAGEGRVGAHAGAVFYTGGASASADMSAARTLALTVILPRESVNVDIVQKYGCVRID